MIAEIAPIVGQAPTLFPSPLHRRTQIALAPLALSAVEQHLDARLVEEQLTQADEERVGCPLGDDQEATTMGEGRGARPQADELPEGVRPAHGPDGAFEVETLELVAGNSPPLGLAPRTEHLGRHEDAPAAKSRIS